MRNALVLLIVVLIMSCGSARPSTHPYPSDAAPEVGASFEYDAGAPATVMVQRPLEPEDDAGDTEDPTEAPPPPVYTEECGNDADCDDGNRCTLEGCYDGVCVHLADIQSGMGCG